MEFPSLLVENAVAEVAKLPGIGKKSALRLVLHLLKEDKLATNKLANALTDLRENIMYCQTCNSISDNEQCRVCASNHRDGSIVCVVEDTRDVLAIENTSQYFGKYHVLGGVISPIDGIGPSELHIEGLLKRAAQEGVKELIFALSPTMEGDTTAFYITKKVKEFNVKVSTIARGIPVGGELEYADEVTLGRSIVARTTYNFQ